METLLWSVDRSADLTTHLGSTSLLLTGHGDHPNSGENPPGGQSCSRRARGDPRPPLQSSLEYVTGMITGSGDLPSESPGAGDSMPCGPNPGDLRTRSP